MLHPSYSDLIATANKDVAPGEEPVVQSRYSIVIAAARRARQIVDGDEPLIPGEEGKKPLSVAVDELAASAVRIVKDEDKEPETAAEQDEAEEDEMTAEQEEAEENDMTEEQEETEESEESEEDLED